MVASPNGMWRREPVLPHEIVTLLMTYRRRRTYPLVLVGGSVHLAVRHLLPASLRLCDVQNQVSADEPSVRSTSQGLMELLGQRARQCRRPRVSQ